MNVTIEKLVFEGKGLARVGGKAVFIPFVLPEEEVEIRITKEHRDYAEGCIEHITKPSSRRVQPRCPYFLQCGGCNMQMADSAYQKELRLAMVEELFIRAGLRAEKQCPVVAAHDWEYRSRFQFHRDAKGILGMHCYGSNNVIAIKDCPIAVPALRMVLQKGALHRLFPQQASVTHKHAENRYHVFAQETVYSATNPTVQVRVHRTILECSVFGFFQSNIVMLEKLIEPVCFALPPCRRVLDFYAGVGTFSAFLTGKAEEIHLVEHNSKALQSAKNNLDRIQREHHHACHYHFHALSDSQWCTCAAAALSYDAAIVDPPRQGLPAAFFAYLSEHPIPRIHYVSCNPATFVRDAKQLAALGYRFAEWTFFDFYPQTHHGELLGVFLK
ncbi:MAG: class I SAM-dependent RNA methyltransferase [Treponema sp.]